MLTFQQIILKLQSYWADQGCALLQPYDMEVGAGRSEEHTSELQSQSNLVCRLLLEKKKKTTLLTLHPHMHDHEPHSDPIHRHQLHPPPSGPRPPPRVVPTEACTQQTHLGTPATSNA